MILPFEKTDVLETTEFSIASLVYTCLFKNIYLLFKLVSPYLMYLAIRSIKLALFKVVHIATQKVCSQ